MPNPGEKTYLGDAVYAQLEESTGMITLTTEDGISVTNRIYLEPFVFLALLEWMEVPIDRSRFIR